MPQTFFMEKMEIFAFQDSLSVHQNKFDEIQKINIFYARDFTTKTYLSFGKRKTNVHIPMPWLNLCLGVKHRCDYQNAASDLNI